MKNGRNSRNNSLTITDRGAFLNLKKVFFQGDGVCSIEDLMDNIKPSFDSNSHAAGFKNYDDVVDWINYHSRDKETFEIKCDRNRIEASIKIKEIDGRFYKKIRRLVNDPGRIRNFFLKNDAFYAIQESLSKGYLEPNNTSRKEFPLELLSKICDQESIYDLYANASCVFRRDAHDYDSSKDKILACYSQKQIFEIVNGYNNKKSKISPKNDQQRFYAYGLKNDSIKTIIINGIFGSGKTLFAVDHGMQSGYRDLRFIIPTETRGKPLGAFPGGIEEKTTVFGTAIREVLYKILEYSEEAYPVIIDDRVANTLGMSIRSNYISKDFNPYPKKNSNKNIMFDVPNFASGRNLVNEFICIDESENLDKGDLKVLMTRGDDTCKVICMGDTEQTKISESGLPYAMKRMAGIPDAMCLRLTQCLRGSTARSVVEEM